MEKTTMEKSLENNIKEIVQNCINNSTIYNRINNLEKIDLIGVYKRLSNLESTLFNLKATLFNLKERNRIIKEHKILEKRSYANSGTTWHPFEQRQFKDEIQNALTKIAKEHKRTYRAIRIRLEESLNDIN